MLMPDEISEIAAACELIASELKDEVLKRVIGAILLRLERENDYILTARDKWMLESLNQAGLIYKDLQAVIARYTGLQMAAIEQAFEDAGVRSFNYDTEFYQSVGLLPTTSEIAATAWTDTVQQLTTGSTPAAKPSQTYTSITEAARPMTLKGSPYYVRLMQRNLEATQGECRNLTRTTADRAQQIYIKACDTAYNLASTGALSKEESTKAAIMEAIKDGLRINYTDDTGRVYHSDTVEVAVTRAVRTGVSQACSKVTEKRMEDMKWDIVLVSAHLGARYGTGKNDHTNHAWWQGKFYSLSGTDDRFSPFSVCGEGEVQGFAGPNCRHSKGPGDGENNPFDGYDSDENKKAYDLSQRQRLLERRIRKAKSDTMLLRHARDTAKTPELRTELDLEYQKSALLLSKRNGTYNDFCTANNLQKRHDRLYVAGWDKSQSSGATAAARKAKK